MKQAKDLKKGNTIYRYSDNKITKLKVVSVKDFPGDILRVKFTEGTGKKKKETKREKKRGTQKEKETKQDKKR